MEINHVIRSTKTDEQRFLWSSSSSSDDQLWNSCNNNHNNNTSSVRSYTCSFCKKGFSNAQALGGHMNIHRKDRAKLREAFDEETLLSLNSMNPSDHNKSNRIQNLIVSDEKDLVLVESSDEEKEGISCIPKTPCSGDSSTAFSDIKRGNSVDGEENMKMNISHGSTEIEVDLELRLGSEPFGASSTTCINTSTSTAIREFF